MHNGMTRLYLSLSGLGLVVAAILSQVHWTLAAACLAFILFGLLAYAAGWHTCHQDMATAQRRAQRRPERRQVAIRVGERAIPVNGRVGHVKETT